MAAEKQGKDRERTTESRKRAGRFVTVDVTPTSTSTNDERQGTLIKSTSAKRGSTRVTKMATPRQLLAERIVHLLDRFSDESVAEALGQDDVGTFTALASPAAWPREGQRPTDAARLRGIQYREALLERAGGSLTVESTARMLGVTGEAIRKRLREHSLLGIKAAKGYLIPALQFEGGQELPGLRRVLRALPVESPWMRLDWLLSPEPRLEGKSPVQALGNGTELQEVVAAAELFGEQGAR